MARDYPQLTRLGLILIQTYERYLPSAFDESMSILQKLNRIEEYVNQTGTLVNSAVDLIENAITAQDLDIVALQEEVSDFKASVSEELLPANLEITLDTWFANGKLAQIINDVVFDMKADQTDLDATNSVMVLKANDVDVRKKSTKIELVDLADPVLTAMQGGASFTLSSIPLNESVTLEKIKGRTLIKGLNLYEKIKHFVTGYINGTGDISYSATFGRAKVPVYSSTVYSAYRPSNDDYSSGAGMLNFLDASGVKISSVVASTLVKGKYNNKSFLTFTTPSNCRFIELNVYLSNYNDSDTFILTYGDEVNSDILNNPEVEYLLNASLSDIKNRQAFETFKESIHTTGNLYKYPSHYTPNFYVNVSGVISSATDWGYALVPIGVADEISIRLPVGNYTGDIGSIGFYTDQKVLVSFVNAPPVDGSYQGVNYVTLDVPVNAFYVGITVKRPSSPIFDNKDSLMVVHGNVIDDVTSNPYIMDIDGIPFYSPTATPATKPYVDIKWGMMGDSLTEKNLRSLMNYHDYIVNETGIQVVNMGVSGTGYKKRDEVNSAFYQRILNMPLDVDVVTIFGSGNDLTLPLGTVTDTGTTTLCGCINTTIDNFYTVHPTTPIGIITPTPWVGYSPATVGNAMELYSDALIEICKRRSIPCLDLYRQSNLRPWDAEFRTLMYSKDDGNGVHPDENGHKVFSPKIREFLKTLI